MCADSTFCDALECELAHSDYAPAWSPDGSTIAYTHSSLGIAQIWLMRSDGSEQGYLTDGGYPDWSPDGQQIVFERARDIYVISLPDSSIERLTQEGSLLSPNWSPDGDLISYSSLQEGAQGIWVMNADGTDQHWLFSAAWADWSPDGREMVFQGPAPDDLQSALWIRELDTGRETRVSEGFLTGAGGHPCWSPGGNLIVWRLSNRRGEIWVFSRQGQWSCRIQSGGAETPSWSPDGQRIAFVRLLPGGIPGSCTKTIWAISSNGGGCTQITFAPEFSE